MPEGTPRYATNGSVTGTLPDGTQCEAVCGLVDAAAMPPEFQESTWSIFFGTKDLDATLETANRLGATTGEIGQSPFGRKTLSGLETPRIELILDIFVNGLYLFDVGRVIHEKRVNLRIALQRS